MKNVSTMFNIVSFLVSAILIVFMIMQWRDIPLPVTNTARLGLSLFMLLSLLLGHLTGEPKRPNKS